MFILIGYIDVEPADAFEFESDIRAVSFSTRAEAGCLFHAISWEDTAAGRMLLVQRWRDDEAFAAHFSTPHASTFLRKWKAKMKSEINRYDVTSERTSVTERTSASR